MNVLEKYLVQKFIYNKLGSSDKTILKISARRLKIERNKELIPVEFNKFVIAARICPRTFTTVCNKPPTVPSVLSLISSIILFTLLVTWVVFNMETPAVTLEMPTVPETLWFTLVTVLPLMLNPPAWIDCLFVRFAGLEKKDFV